MQPTPSPRSQGDSSRSRAEAIYAQLKDDLFGLRLMPGDRFSEGELAERMRASRTPVRQALHRLEREGHVEVVSRSGWRVRAFDFTRLEELYEICIVLELEAVRRLGERPAAEVSPLLDQLGRTWLVAPERRLKDGQAVSRLDEGFHRQLLDAAGNGEMARLHADVSERIRVVRQLDFTQAARVTLAYEEHGKILGALLTKRNEDAQRLLKAHLEVSKAEVRTITLHMLHSARPRDLPARQG